VTFKSPLANSLDPAMERPTPQHRYSFPLHEVFTPLNSLNRMYAMRHPVLSVSDEGRLFRFPFGSLYMAFGFPHVRAFIRGLPLALCITRHLSWSVSLVLITEERDESYTRKDYL
jgi:hypothetical protein